MEIHTHTHTHTHTHASTHAHTHTKAAFEEQNVLTNITIKNHTHTIICVFNYSLVMPASQLSAAAAATSGHLASC